MKLYCRIKVNGKWTFRAACLNYMHVEGHDIDCECFPSEQNRGITE